MNDRELLELAAKVGGIAGEYRAGLGICPPELSQLHKFWWNPLTDDGDALRLAVKLRLDIMFFEGFQEVYSSHCSAIYTECLEEYGEDIMASTRRAIVRAAAEIGKSMGEEKEDDQ